MHIDKEQQIKRNIASEKETTTEANIKTETVIGISAEMDSCNSGFSFEEKPVEYLGTVLDENTILKKDIETVKENLYQLNPLDDDLTYDPSHEEIVSYLKELLLVKCNSLQASKLKDDINYYLNTSVYIRDLYCNFTHWKKGIEYMIDLLHNRRIALRILDKELGDEDRDFMVKYFYSVRVMEKNERVKYLFVSEKYVKDQNKGSQSFEEWFKAMQVKAGEFFHSCVSSNILGAYLTVLYQDPEYACFQDMNTGDLDTFQHVDLLLKTYPEFKIQDFAHINFHENKNYNMRDEIMKSCYEKTIEYVKDNIFPKTKQQELQNIIQTDALTEQNDIVPKSNEIYKTSQENKVELDICIKGAA